MIREFIKRMLLEVYEMTKEEQEEKKEIEAFWGEEDDIGRAVGLQDPETIRRERSLLSDYQKKLNSTKSGKQMIKDFRTGRGNISIAHSITYDGFAVNAGSKEGWKGRISKSNPFTEWLKKWGNNNRDVISTVSWPKPLGYGPGRSWKNNQNWQVLTGLGFMMKGYPVFISRQDVMSQTLDSLPAGLKAHQKSSGIAKRPGSIDTAIYGDDPWSWSAETLLDNWKPIGIFLSQDFLWNVPVATAMDIIEDAKSTGLPCWIIENAIGGLGHWIPDNEWPEDRDDLYLTFF